MRYRDDVGKKCYFVKDKKGKRYKTCMNQSNHMCFLPSTCPIDFPWPILTIFPVIGIIIALKCLCKNRGEPVVQKIIVSEAPVVVPPLKDLPEPRFFSPEKITTAREEE